MKLSILIPTYNYDPRPLVAGLLEQLPEGGEAEVIVGDDGSTPAVQLRAENVRVYRPVHNLGRAGIRNALAREARGEWLLFVDVDAEVTKPNFISTYLAACGQAQVVCGGTGNLPSCPRPQARLRYDCEVRAEQRLTLARRKAHPYAQFTTFNFMIRRSLFLSIGFDERLKSYGHEDTLFGLELKKRGIHILHIENKLTHLGLEDADEYLRKTETALQSLARMPDDMRRNARVSALAMKLERCHLHALARVIYNNVRPRLRANLLGSSPSQLLFAFYKLGFYLNLRQSESGSIDTKTNDQT